MTPYNTLSLRDCWNASRLSSNQTSSNLCSPSDTLIYHLPSITGTSVLHSIYLIYLSDMLLGCAVVVYDCNRLQVVPANVSGRPRHLLLPHVQPRSPCPTVGHALRWEHSTPFLRDLSVTSLPLSLLTRSLRLRASMCRPIARQLLGAQSPGRAGHRQQRGVQCPGRQDLHWG